MKDKNRINIFFLIFIILILCDSTIGCICDSFSQGSKQKTPESPKDSLVSARETFKLAVNYTEEKLHENYTYEYIVNLSTMSLGGNKCSWDGPNSGNCTSWTYILNAIIFTNNQYRLIESMGSCYYLSNNLEIESISIKIWNVTIDELNATINKYENLSIDIKYDSHEIYQIAEKQRGEIGTNSYIRDVEIKVEKDTWSTEPLNNGRPYWEILWSLKNRDEEPGGYSKSVAIDAINGTIVASR